MIDVGLFTMLKAATLGPVMTPPDSPTKVTVAPVRNPLPVIVTAVPPKVEPPLVLIVEMPGLETE